MRVISWIRARYESTAALLLARRAYRVCKSAEAELESLHDRLGDTDHRVIQLRESFRSRINAIKGPSPASDGLSLAVLREQICRTEQRICNAHASIRVLRDSGENQARRIAALEARLDGIEARFASHRSATSVPSWN